MARAFLRQTFIALRARRQAYRIATDFLYDQPIDVETINCRACGKRLKRRRMSAKGWIRCRRCGVFTKAPPHLRTPRVDPYGRPAVALDYGPPPEQSGWRIEIPSDFAILTVTSLIMLFGALIVLLITWPQ
jgi:hypothetical protein